MLKMFAVCFVIAFGAVVIACGVNGGAWDTPDWLMAECIGAALISVPIYCRFAPLLRPVVYEFEFDDVSEDDEEIDE